MPFWVTCLVETCCRGQKAARLKVLSHFCGVNVHFPDEVLLHVLPDCRHFWHMLANDVRL